MKKEKERKTGSDLMAIYDEKRRLKDSKVIIPTEDGVKEAKEFVEENEK